MDRGSSCESLAHEAAVSHWPMLGQTLDCELLCGSAEKKVDKAILCDKIRSITENKDAFDSSYFSTAKRFCSKQSDPMKCHSDSAAFHPIVLEALDYAAEAIGAHCSKPVEVKAAFSNATTPMKCVLCKYLLNWIGECFVEDNKTSREMQNSIRNIVKKVCDLNKICTVFHCSCEKIAEKAIDIIKGMDVSEKACVKHDPSCSGLHLAANRVYT
uniref:Saposin B-type domain-containing protein n=1 Tax=Steinernema glaseri TaxID=37863 RepID=A0A1I7ZG50_9BILA